MGCVSETASDGHGMRVATVGFPTIYQGSATLRTSRTNRFTYSVAGMIDHVDTVDSSGTLRTTYYKYDDARRRRQADSPEGVLTWQRDAQGNIIAMQSYRRSAVGINAEVTGGTTTDVDVAYGYDAMNRLSSVTDRKVSTTRSLGYAFDAAGRVQTATYPNGATNRFTYDARHRLLKTDWWQTNGTLMRAFSYTLGAGGVRVAVNESDPTNSNRRSISWQYDVNGTNQLARLYRLTSETITNLGSLGTEQHLYDLVGNRLSRSVTGFITNSVPTNSAWTDNARDELIGDTYDGAGNTTLGASLSLTNPDSYDAENHLILRGTNTSSVVQIDYDAFGNRVKKTAVGTTIWYLIDDQSPSGYQQVVAEFNSLSSAPLRTYAYGLSLINIVGSGTTSYALTDGQGSVRALFSDTAGASLTDNYDFDAYGVLTASTGSTVNNYRYTGQQWDPDLQLYYLRARYYAPTLGRFWSSDSYEGSPETPASLHKYLYCRASPINGVDPSGHDELIGLVLANSLGSVLDAGYNGSVGGSGQAIQHALLGVQAGLTADAIILRYVIETIDAGAAGYIGFRILGKAFDLGSKSTLSEVEAEAALYKEAQLARLPIGTKVYRVYIPGQSRWNGRYWTTIDPRRVANFADAAGLPTDIAEAIRSGEAKMAVGEIGTEAAIKIRAAENIPGTGNRGGLLEVQLDSAQTQLRNVTTGITFP